MRTTTQSEIYFAVLICMTLTSCTVPREVSELRKDYEVENEQLAEAGVKFQDADLHFLGHTSRRISQVRSDELQELLLLVQDSQAIYSFCFADSLELSDSAFRVPLCDYSSGGPFVSPYRVAVSESGRYVAVLTDPSTINLIDRESGTSTSQRMFVPALDARVDNTGRVHMVEFPCLQYQYLVRWSGEDEPVRFGGWKGEEDLDNRRKSFRVLLAQRGSAGEDLKLYAVSAQSGFLEVFTDTLLTNSGLLASPEISYLRQFNILAHQDARLGGITYFIDDIDVRCGHLFVLTNLYYLSECVGSEYAVLIFSQDGAIQCRLRLPTLKAVLPTGISCIDDRRFLVVYSGTDSSSLYAVNLSAGSFLTQENTDRQPHE